MYSNGSKLMLVFAVIAIAYVLLQGIYENRKFTQLMKLKIDKNFGKNPTEKDIDRSELFNHIEKNENYIDKITFNDLNLDRLIKKLDHTQSIVGAEYLYNAIRQPVHNFDYHKRLKAIRNYFVENENVAKDVALEFSILGKFKKPIVDVIYNGFDYDSYKKFKLPVLIMSKAIFFIIALGFFNRNLAVFLGLITITINFYISFSLKKATSGVVTDFFNISLVLNTAKKLEAFNIPIVDEEFRKLKELNERVSKIRKNTSSSMQKVVSVNDSDALVRMLDYFLLGTELRFFKTSDLINLNLKELQELYITLGKIDYYVALASIYKSNSYCDVEFFDGEVFNGTNLKHPLLGENQVANSFDFNGIDVLLTGSNASGKSTFLRSVGISNVMAFSLGFVFADSYSTGLYKLETSIDLSDSIENNLSYFMQESLAIKRMIEPSSVRKMLLLDEIFRGTNTIDRISAAYNTLSYLGKNALVIAATHDIELTKLLETFKNYHFEENILDDDINFDYLLKEGPARSRNAIEILRVVGYPDEIISGSRKLASNLEREKSLRNENLFN